MPSYRDQLLARTFIAEDTVFASGQRANNKADADRVQEGSPLFLETCYMLGALAVDMEPDAITYVPTGARRFAVRIAGQFQIPLIEMERSPENPGRTNYRYVDDASRVVAEESERIVVVEDVTSTLASVNGVLEIPGIRPRARGLVAILRRGLASEERPIGIESRWLIEEHMPAQMGDEQLAQYLSLATLIGDQS